MVAHDAFLSDCHSQPFLFPSDEAATAPSECVPSQCLNEAEIFGIRPLRSWGSSIQTRAGEVRLLRFQMDDEVKLEFFLNRHMVIFFPDGIFGESEWRNEVRNRTISSSPPGAIVFNPSRERLRLRVRKVKYEFQALLLLIEPASLNCFHDETDDNSSLTLQQQLDMKVEEVAQTLRKIRDELKCPGPYIASYVHALIMLAVAGLMRGLSNRERSPQSTCVKGGLPNWRLKRALELLEGSLSEAPTLAELARPLKLHPTSFCRAFKQSTGQTPHRYLLLCRVNRSKEMMKDLDRTLTDIALDCGFSSSAQFSVVFKRIEGISPRSFRRAL